MVDDSILPYEATVEDWVARNPELLGDPYYLQRQPTIPGAGRPDIIAIRERHGTHEVLVVEIKRKKAGIKAVRQLLRYNRALAGVPPESYERAGPTAEVHGMLIAARFTAPALEVLASCHKLSPLRYGISLCPAGDPRDPFVGSPHERPEATSSLEQDEDRYEFWCDLAREVQREAVGDAE